ncbi:MAG: tRNA glutamyl-Q(34) synthetase GluQRS [Trueperaceae bacterium]
MTVAHGAADTITDSRGERPYRGRFAPSPSGWLHLGNARTALVAWLRARAQGGAFVMRVEDLDGPRTRQEAVRGNLDELRWLGLDWDEGPDVGGPHGPYLQSQRSELYEAALERLAAAGLTFPCYLSRKELAVVASAPHGNVSGGASEGVYGAAERAANERLATAKQAEGRAPSVRVAVPNATLRFSDALAGAQEVNLLPEVGHFVVRRSDGLFAYQLAVVVDDAAMGITEVVRGADLLRSTAAQLLLYRALGQPPPGFAHVPLLLDESGQRLAKRRGSLTLHELRAAGVEPGALVGLLGQSLGLVPAGEEATAPELLAEYRQRQGALRFSPIDLGAALRPPR